MADKETRKETQKRHTNPFAEETLEFAKIKDALEEYGAIMQACIEEAERTIQIWRGRPIPDDVVVKMLPAVSVALFEKITEKMELDRDMTIRDQTWVKFRLHEKYKRPGVQNVG